MSQVTKNGNRWFACLVGALLILFDEQRYMLGIVSRLFRRLTRTILIFTDTTGKVMNLDELAEVRGRAWEDVDH